VKEIRLTVNNCTTSISSTPYLCTHSVLSYRITRWQNLYSKKASSDYVSFTGWFRKAPCSVHMLPTEILKPYHN